MIMNESTVLRGLMCEAEYVEQQVPLYKNNPLIEALPIPWEQYEVSKLISFFPPYDNSQRGWPKTIRMQCVEQLLHFVQPLTRHIELASSISCAIRTGYISRNPLSPLFKRQFVVGFRQLLEEGLDKYGVNMAGIRPTACGFAIMGLSGMGKSLGAEKNVLNLPQVIRHTIYHGEPFILKQIVWLKLDCPSSGSLGLLCENFFRAIDLILETNYFKKHVTAKSTKLKLLGPMAQVASLHGLGILVIDEVQRLSLQKNGGGHEMLNFFTELINTIGIPIVLIGTHKSESLFNSVFAEARRACGPGHDTIKNMPNGPEWKLFLDSLWRFQWTKKVVSLTPELRETMYWESQGILDIAVKLYIIAQWRAISRGKEEVTVELLQEMANEKLKLVQPMLNALRCGDWELVKLLDTGDSKGWLNTKSCKQEDMTFICKQGKISGDKNSETVNIIQDKLVDQEQLENRLRDNETLPKAKKAPKTKTPFKSMDLRGIAVNKKLVNVPILEKLEEFGVSRKPKELMI